MLRRDSEPAILALKEAAHKESDVDIVIEESPAVGDHQANGTIGNGVMNAQGQFMAVKDALESRYGRRVEGDHLAVPWMMMQAVSVVSRERKDDEGFTAYRR